MGRRFLRKVDANLDLSFHLRSIEDLDPWNPSEWYGRTAPLEIEVGSGKGLFIANAASSTPTHDFLGIEIAGKYCRFCAARLNKLNISNAFMMHGDAQPLFERIIPDTQLAAVHIYFPDPWWKKRHHKRRIMNESFLRQVHRVLQPGGRLHFWTDVEEYYRESLDLIDQTLPYSAPLAVPESVPDHDLDYRTHFERRTRLHGQSVYRCYFEK